MQQSNVQSAAARPVALGASDLENFVTAGLYNLQAACSLKFWVKPFGASPNALLDLRPADGFFIDRVRGLQSSLGLPVTGRVDAATWAVFKRHGALAAVRAPGTSPADALINNIFSLGAVTDSLEVRYCGESRARHGAFSASSAEAQQALFENTRQRPLNLGTLRTAVFTLGAEERTPAGTRVFGITFDQVLRSALWNQYVAGVTPATQTAYPTRKEDRLGIKIRNGVPGAYQLGGSSLVTLIAQWELTKGWPPVGMLTPRVVGGILAEIKADTEWGRRLNAILNIPGVVQLAKPMAKGNSQSQAALQRELTAAQANQTQSLRVGTQVRRDQYARMSSAATSSRGLVAARETQIGRDAEIAVRRGIVPSGGRQGFTPAFAFDPRMVPGGPVVVGGNRGPANDAEPPAATPPAAAPPASHDPAPWSAGDGAWSSATAEEIAAAQRRDDEDSWAFDENGQPVSRGGVPVEELPADTVLPDAVVPPEKKSKKGLLLLAGVLVGGYFLLREG